MRQRLVNLLGEVQGKDEICLLKSQTIREIIEELQAMVQPKDPANPTVVITSRTPFAGFDLSVDPAASAGTATVPHVMDWSSDGSLYWSAFTDTWDISAPPGGTDGVSWRGPRLIMRATSPDFVTYTDTNGDTVDIMTAQMKFLTRKLTFSSSGSLVAIAAEEEISFPVMHTYTP